MQIPKRGMMYPLRRNVFPLILAGALFAPAAHAAQPAGPGPGHGSVLQVATVPTRTRPRRGIQGAKLRAIAWCRRAVGAATTGRAANAKVRPQLSTSDSSAR